jgi:hypothetical protein
MAQRKVRATPVTPNLGRPSTQGVMAGTG